MTMMKKTGLLAFFAISGVLTFVGCGRSESALYVLDNVELVAEGPLFEGSNTLQGTVRIDPAMIADGLTADRIKKVKLKSVKLYSADSIPFRGIRSFILQITADNAGMQQAAVANPLKAEGKEAGLLVAEEADFKDLFQQRELIIVADADLDADREESLIVHADLAFTVEFKK